MTEVCSLKNITKSFGSVVANNNINFSVASGEIHALLGENGSGKSTLMNILSGIYSPDSGEISLRGKPTFFESPADAIKAGIGMVHQHFKLVELLSATENIIAGERSGLMINKAKAKEKIMAISDRYGLKIDPDKKVYNMSVGEKQTVEILKVLYRGAEILILDEPTAVLTPQEIHVLFDILKCMKKDGCAIVIITHKLNEVMEVSDKVTVLRKGETIKTLNTSETNPRELTELMVGRKVDLNIACPKYPSEKMKKVLEVKDLCVKNSDGVFALKDVSFSVNSGEILGVAAVAGSGQKELCETIAGLDRALSGEILFKDRSIVKLSPRDIIRMGISMSFIPEDRLGMGLVAGMDIAENVLLKSFQNMPGIFIDRVKGTEMASEIIKRFDISTPGPHHIVKKLSGGNIQKVLLGREINLNPELLITAYPVRGLDIGASYNIYDVLNEQKQKGVAIVFVGEDLDVLLHLCDRIMVLCGGEVMGIVKPSEGVTKEDLGMLMLGEKSQDNGGAA